PERQDFHQSVAFQFPDHLALQLQLSMVQTFGSCLEWCDNLHTGACFLWLAYRRSLPALAQTHLSQSCLYSSHGPFLHTKHCIPAVQSPECGIYELAYKFPVSHKKLPGKPAFIRGFTLLNNLKQDSIL